MGVTDGVNDIEGVGDGGPGVDVGVTDIVGLKDIVGLGVGVGVLTTPEQGLTLALELPKLWESALVCSWALDLVKD